MLRMRGELIHCLRKRKMTDAYSRLKNLARAIPADTQAKETVDLLRMARAITRLDALDAEIDAVRGRPNRRKVSRLGEEPRSGRLL